MLSSIVLFASLQIGPFFETREDYLAVRPFYAQEGRDTDVLWPLFTAHDDWWRALMFIHWQENAESYQFEVMPFWFTGRTRAGEKYAGLFPIYGRHPHILLMHDFEFALWPLWTKYSMPRKDAPDGRLVTRSVLFPFFSWRDDGAWSVWPFYGVNYQRESDHRYVLWPFATWASYREDRDTAGAGSSWMLWPLVGRINSRLRGDGSAWGTTQDNAWATAGLAAFLNGAELPTGVQFVRVVTTGIPKKPFPRPAPVKLTRRYLDAAGKEVSRIKKGELVTVELTLRSPGHIENAVLADILPAGRELEDDTFKTRSQKVPGAEKAPDGFIRLSGRSELRDDRYLWFGSVDGLKDDRRHLLEYRVRAVTPGTYHVPSATVEDMYNPDLRGGIEGNGVFTVE